MAMHDSGRMPPALHVLLRTQFGLFLGGNGLSLVGTWMQRIACGWLVWDWTHSAFWLGILSASDLLPSVVIGPFAGVAADRWDRLRQNILAQTASAALAILTAVLLATNHLSLWAMILLVTAQGSLTAAIQPARLAMVQQMVAREDTGVAVALSSVTVNLTRLIGPAAAGAMILYLDVVWVFIVNALVTVLFVLILTRLRLTAQAIRAARQSFLGEMTEGIFYILSTRPLWLILLVMLCGGSMVRAMTELIPAIAASTFANGAKGLAILTGSAAAGAVVSGLTMGRGRARDLLREVLAWWGFGALAAIVLTHATYPVMAMGAAAMIGFASTRGMVSTQTFVQMTTPDVLRGRVLSIHGLIARGSPALGALVIGFSADRIGLSHAVEVSSAALIVCLVAFVPLVRSVSSATTEIAQ